jgi:Flp pilus assembly protein TadB
MKLTMLIISTILSYLIFKIYKEVFKEKIVEKAIEKKISENENGYFSKKRIEKFLISRGIDYISPVSYIILKFAIAFMILVMCFMELGIYTTIPGAVIGFFLLDIMIELSNNQDNKNFSYDIVRIFDSIRIQISAGAYITDTLKESYLIARHKRLKKALSELNADLMLTNDLEESVNKFNSKFKCKYIDTLCLSIIQGDETGQINRILEDTSESMKEIQRIIQNEEKKSVELKSSMIQLLVYLGVLAIVVFGLINQLTSGLSDL